MKEVKNEQAVAIMFSSVTSSMVTVVSSFCSSAQDALPWVLPLDLALALLLALLAAAGLAFPFGWALGALWLPASLRGLRQEAS